MKVDTKMDVLLAGMGVMLIFEGIPWFLGPERVKGFLQAFMAIDNGTLRGIGLLLMLSGLLIVYLAVA